ncbi:MAG: hypothetical protein ACOYJK_09760 [Prevotella sp.]|jgi:hypothetical protein
MKTRKNTNENEQLQKIAKLAEIRNEDSRRDDLVAYDGMIGGLSCTLCDLCVLQMTPSKHYYCTKTQKEINNTIADVCQFYQYGRGHADTHTRTSKQRESRKRRE